MEIGGRTYSQATFYSPDFMNERNGYLGMVGSDFHEIVNKWLADEGADYRIHRAPYHRMWHGMPAMGYDRIGLIALTADQSKYIRRISYDLLNIPQEMFDEYAGPRGIERAVTAYKKLGLLDHLSGEQIAEGTAKALSTGLNSVNDILRQFKDVIVEIPLETLLWDQLYADNLRGLAQATRGAFSPSNIVDGYRVHGPSQFDFAFDVGKRSYHTTLHMEDDWLDPKFFELVDSAIAESVPDGRFYHLRESDGGDMIFLTRAQRDELRARKLFLFAPETDEEWNEYLEE
jgi:hypothetical protein